MTGSVRRRRTYGSVFVYLYFLVDLGTEHQFVVASVAEFSQLSVGFYPTDHSFRQREISS